MKTSSLQMSYRYLNNYLGWEQEDRGRFRKAISHIMCKTFNNILKDAQRNYEHFRGMLLAMNT